MLETKYPQYFKKYLRGRSIEVGDGWLPIVDNMLRELQDSNLEVDIIQIKEKFGFLTIYTHKEDVEISLIIQEAITAASESCDVCGKAGTLRNNNGWYMVRCEEHV